MFFSGMFNVNMNNEIPLLITSLLMIYSLLRKRFPSFSTGYVTRMIDIAQQDSIIH
jgi:hypothetical protein